MTEGGSGRGKELAILRLLYISANVKDTCFSCQKFSKTKYNFTLGVQKQGNGGHRPWATQSAIEQLTVYDKESKRTQIQ